jgi:hypothetical protein
LVKVGLRRRGLPFSKSKNFGAKIMFELRRALLAAAVATAVFSFGAISTAQAITCTGNQNAPDSCTDADPLTVYPKNTPKDSLNGSPFLGKLDLNEDGSIKELTGDYADYFSISNFTLKDGNEVIGGDWTFDAAAAALAGLPLVPTMLAVKAGPNWFFYDIVAGVFSGSWDTDLLGDKGTSHLSWYDGAAPPTGNNPVPLPGAVWLFGTALAGLGFLGMRRRRAKTSF